jgi:hypothetical protein
MEPYYICDCPNCGNPKYSKAKKTPIGKLLERMQTWECYSCSRKGEKNPAYGVAKTDDWLKKVSTSLKGKNTWSGGRTLTHEHKQNITNGLYLAYETNKRKSDGYIISLGMENGLAKGLTRDEYDKLISDKKRYYNEVHKITNRQNIQSLEYYENRGKSRKGTDNYQLDHIIPISEGFRNNIDPKIIGDITNLRFIPWLENILRNKQNKLI